MLPTARWSKNAYMMVEKMSHLASAIRQARTTKKLTQSDLAALAKVSRATIVQLEAGRGRLDSLIAVGDCLDLAFGTKGLPPADDAIGVRLAALRTTRGYSLRSISERAGITRPSIRNIEAGKPTAQIAAVVKLAAALGVSLALSGKFKAHFQASEFDAWLTPPDLVAVLSLAVNVNGRWDLDPASPGEDASFIKAHRHITKAENGLDQPWSGNVWLNPPYGREVPVWLEKARAEVEAGNARIVVMLLSARTDTRWYHDYVSDAWHRYLRGRVQFHPSMTSGPAQAAPVGSVVVVYGGDDGDRQRINAALNFFEGRLKAA